MPLDSLAFTTFPSPGFQYQIFYLAISQMEDPNDFRIQNLTRLPGTSTKRMPPMYYKEVEELMRGHKDLLETVFSVYRATGHSHGDAGAVDKPGSIGAS